MHKARSKNRTGQLVQGRPGLKSYPFCLLGGMILSKSENLAMTVLIGRGARSSDGEKIQNFGRSVFLNVSEKTEVIFMKLMKNEMP